MDLEDVLKSLANQLNHGDTMNTHTDAKLPEDFDVFEELIELGLLTNSGPDVTHLEKCLDA